MLIVQVSKFETQMRFVLTMLLLMQFPPTSGVREAVLFLFARVSLLASALQVLLKFTNSNSISGNTGDEDEVEVEDDELLFGLRKFFHLPSFTFYLSARFSSH